MAAAAATVQLLLEKPNELLAKRNRNRLQSWPIRGAIGIINEAASAIATTNQSSQTAVVVVSTVE